MRKVNKILMSAVAILLCLVLITTSVVSGIFARFTIYKKSETSVSFQSFGVNVTMTVDEDGILKQRVGEDNIIIDKIGDSIHVTIQNLTLYPGDGDYYAPEDATDEQKAEAEKLANAFRRAVKFDIGGKAGVPLAIKIYADLEYVLANYSVPADVLNAICGTTDKTSEDYFVPTTLRFTAIDEDNVLTEHNANSPWRNVAPSTAEQTFATVVKRYTDLTSNKSDSDNKNKYAYKSFNTGDDIVLHPEEYTEDKNDNLETQINSNLDINTFYLGFAWLYSKSAGTSGSNRYYTATQMNEISTWLTENRDMSIDIKFILEVVPT